MADEPMRIRDSRTQKRFFVDNTILDRYGKELGPYGIAVYVALCRYADKNTQTCFPSYQTIADLIGASRGKVGEILCMLREQGLIAWKQKARSGGKGQTSNTYYILDPPVHVVDTPRPQDGQAPVHVVDTNNPQLEQSSVENLPAPTAQGLDELEYVPIEGDEFGEGVPRRPRWQVPETNFHRAFLGVCRAKWFRPRQKTQAKKLSMCLDIGEVLTGADCYERCLEELAGCDNFPDRPIAMPWSWYAWRVEHAKANRWSVDGFIKALFDRDALVRHCQVKLKKLGVPVKLKYQEEDMEVCELGTVG